MVKKKNQAALSAVTLLIIASCAPLAAKTPAATQVLPPPIVQITHAPTSAPMPTPTSTPLAKIPIPKSDIDQLADELFGTRQIESISIPALNLESEVIPVGWRVRFNEDLQSGAFEWDSPDSKVGWVITSSLPDEVGNIILYGHNNTYGKIFQDLYDLKVGKKIYLQTGDQRWEYEVRYRLLLPILGASAEQIESYQQYLLPTQDARVTIISCWPALSNTHRVIIIAKLTEKNP